MLVEAAETVNLVLVVEAFDVDAGRLEAVGVGDALVAEGVEAGRQHRRRRQPREAPGPQRESVGVGHVDRTVEVLLEVPLDAVHLQEVARSALIVGVEPADRRGIDRRVDEQLMCEVGAVAVPCGQRDGGREVAAGAVARYRHPAGVPLQVGGVGRGPLGRPVAVLDPGGEGVFRRAPVVDGDDDAVGLVRQQPAGTLVGVQRATDPPAAVEEDDQRERPLAVGDVDPERHRAVRAPYLEVGDRPDGFGVLDGEEVLEHFAARCHRQRRGRRRDAGVQLLQHRRGLRVEVGVGVGVGHALSPGSGTGDGPPAGGRLGSLGECCGRIPLPWRDPHQKPEV